MNQKRSCAMQPRSRHGGGDYTRKVRFQCPCPSIIFATGLSLNFLGTNFLFVSLVFFLTDSTGPHQEGLTDSTGPHQEGGKECFFSKHRTSKSKKVWTIPKKEKTQFQPIFGYVYMLFWGGIVQQKDGQNAWIDEALMGFRLLWNKPNIWSNYSELTRPHPKKVAEEGKSLSLREI